MTSISAIHRGAAACFLTLLVGCSSGEPDDGPQLRSSAILVETGEDRADAPPPDLPAPGSSDPDEVFVVSGHVEATSFAQVRFDVPGRVESILVERGQLVRRGDVLAILETSDREARLSDARGRLRDARAASPTGAVTASGEPPPAYLRSEIERRLDEVEDHVAQERQDLARFERAAIEGGEEAARDEAIRTATRRGQGQRRRSATRRAADERLSGALIQDLSQRVRHLEDAIASSRLVAPVDGVVVLVGVRVGSRWNTRDLEPAFEILDPSSHLVRAPVPSGLVDVMQPREKVLLDLGPTSEVVTGMAWKIEEQELRMPMPEGGTERVREVLFTVAPEIAATLEVGQAVDVAIRR